MFYVFIFIKIISKTDCRHNTNFIMPENVCGIGKAKGQMHFSFSKNVCKFHSQQ